MGAAALAAASGHPGTVAHMAHKDPARRHVPRAARSLASLWPPTPANLAEVAIRRHLRRRERLAAADPAWAEIEARRRTGAGRVVFLSADLGLGFPEAATQERIAETALPNPWWMPAAQRLRHWHLHRVTGEVRHRYQRAARGWSHADAWSAGRHLATIAADMCDHVAANTHSWPHSAVHPTFEDWQADLTHHAAALRRWVNSEGEGGLTSHWYTAASDADRQDEAEELFAELHALQESNVDGARAAMRWIAEHLDGLWD